MKSKARVMGHPLHPMLIVFPLGLLSTAVIFDGIRLATRVAHWSDVSFWLIAAGLIGGLLAAIPGVIDFLAIPDGTRARKIAMVHGLGNVVVLLLFFWSFMLRWNAPLAPTSGAMWLSLIGLLLALVTGWLGGELVDRLGVGVDPGANLDAPSSLTHETTGAIGVPLT